MANYIDIIFLAKLMSKIGIKEDIISNLDLYNFYKDYNFNVVHPVIMRRSNNSSKIIESIVFTHKSKDGVIAELISENGLLLEVHRDVPQKTVETDLIDFRYELVGDILTNTKTIIKYEEEKNYKIMTAFSKSVGNTRESFCFDNPKSIYMDIDFDNVVPIDPFEDIGTFDIEDVVDIAVTLNDINVELLNKNEIEYEKTVKENVNDYISVRSKAFYDYDEFTFRDIEEI